MGVLNINTTSFHVRMGYLILLLLSVFACERTGRQIENEGYRADYEPSGDLAAIKQSAPPDAFMQSTGPSDSQVTKKEVRSGHIEFQSLNVEEDNQKILDILPDYEAYVQSENQSRSPNRITYNLMVRVPSDHYDELFSDISALAYRLENKNSNVEDVTEQYYDLETRIRNNKALEQRYLQLLEQAKTVEEILEVEKNINQVRTEIERLEGQFRYLSQQVRYSSINISFYEELPYVFDSSHRKGFLARILGGLDSGWQGFLTFLVGITTLWPFLLILILVVIIYRKTRKRKELR